jgi:type I restriction enzyme S subunit
MSSKKKTTATKEDGKPALLPKLRFPEFREADGWDATILGELSEVVRGGSPRPIDGFMTTSADGLNWLKIGDVDKEAKFVTQTAEKVRREALSKTRVVNPGDLILSNSMSFGRPYILQITTCIHDGWIAITKISKKTERDFLYYLISAPGSQSYFVDNAAGSGVQNLNADLIKALPVCFPTPAEQQKIAECLSSVDELMAAQSRKVDTLKTHKKGLMQQLFPREGETQPRLRFPEFQDAGEWEEQPFGEYVAKSFYGTSSSTSPTGQYPVLRMGNMANGGLDFTNMVYIDLDPDSFESFRLEDGDILLNRTNSPALVGKISIFRLKSECITASYIVTYRLNKKRVEPSFCNLMLNTPLHQAKIKALAKPSVSQANINPTTFKKELIVSVPTLPEQQRIADCLTSLDDLIAAQTQKLEALKTHKKGLMQQLFPSPEEIES